MSYSCSLTYLSTSLTFQSPFPDLINHISFICSNLQSNFPLSRERVYTIRKGTRGFSLIHNRNILFQDFPPGTALENVEISIEMMVISENPEFVFFHAGTVSDREGNVSLIIADSGGGKTTLCAMLAQQGLHLEGDELVSVSPKRPLRPIPFSKALKVRKESLAFLKGKGRRLVVTTEKRSEDTLVYWLPDDAVDVIPDEKKKIQRLFSLCFSPNGPNGFSQLSTSEAVKRLMGACHSLPDQRMLALNTVLSIVREAEAFEITYNHPDFALTCVQGV